MIEIQRLTRVHFTYRKAEARAERREADTLSLLALLVIYIVAVTFFA